MDDKYEPIIIDVTTMRKITEEERERYLASLPDIEDVFEGFWLDVGEDDA